MEHLQYPIGRFTYGKTYSEIETQQSINELKDLVFFIKRVINKFKMEDFGKAYRDNGWTATQIINHLCDVYINAYIRTKWLLTESGSILKPYDQNAFSNLPDSFYENVDESVDLLDCLIKRWVYLLNRVERSNFQRKIYHPENKIYLTLDEMVAMYAWHGYHHLAHLKIINNIVMGVL
ncbi:MAG TPA: putative metal-dependent hydrolase [Mucilaginibacter sp.]|jgi:hypothetical protein|nr:putative metal-dependent hydrolase [Mucilaginibacter sp.]